MTKKHKYEIIMVHTVYFPLILLIPILYTSTKFFLVAVTTECADELKQICPLILFSLDRVTIKCCLMNNVIKCSYRYM